MALYGNLLEICPTAVSFTAVRKAVRPVKVCLHQGGDKTSHRMSRNCLNWSVFLTDTVCALCKKQRQVSCAVILMKSRFHRV